MEVAAGAVIAEEVVSTAVQGSAVALAIAHPTGPLRAIFHQIGSAPQSESPDSLARSSHSITAIDGDIYVYGGSVAKSTLAGPEMHILKLSNVSGSGADYKSVPPLAENESDPTPAGRAGHAALSPTEGPCKGKIVMYGGFSDLESQKPIDEDSRVWVFDPATMFWTHMDPASSSVHPGPRANLAMVAWKNTIIIHGGKAKSSTSTSTADAPAEAVDTWQFDLDTKTWSELPAIAAAPHSHSPEDTASPPLFTISDDKLWLVTSPADHLSTTVHFFDLAAWHKTTTTQNPSDMAAGEEATPWVTLSIPTNPLTPGPSLRSGARIETISTGLGRRYLLLMLGTADPADEPASTTPYTSTLWSLQLPSSTTTPAAAKDATRDALPKTSSRALEWHAVDVEPKDEAPAGAAQQSWLGSARSGVQGFLSTNVGGAASWVRRKASVAGLKAADLAGASAGREPPVSPTTAVEGEPGPVLEDVEAKQDAAASPTVQTVPPVPVDDDHDEDADGASVRSGEPTSGKAHPGPRGYFGSAVLQTPLIGAGLSGPSEQGAHVLLWGGVNAIGDREGDGWLVEVKV